MLFDACSLLRIVRLLTVGRSNSTRSHPGSGFPEAEGKAGRARMTAVEPGCVPAEMGLPAKEEPMDIGDDESQVFPAYLSRIRFSPRRHDQLQGQRMRFNIVTATLGPLCFSDPS